MPYIEAEDKIFTKVRGTAESFNGESRQAVLQVMYEDPDSVKTLYRKEFEIFVLFHDGKNFCLGYLHPKYKNVLRERVTRISAWKITGGYPLQHPEYKNLKARFGINLTIEIVKKLEENVN